MHSTHFLFTEYLYKYSVNKTSDLPPKIYWWELSSDWPHIILMFRPLDYPLLHTRNPIYWRKEGNVLFYHTPTHFIYGYIESDRDRENLLLPPHALLFPATSKGSFICTNPQTSFQPVLHDWCNKGHGMCYPVCGMVHIKEPLLLIEKSSPCGGSGFPLSLSEWSFTIYLMPYNRK